MNASPVTLQLISSHEPEAVEPPFPSSGKPRFVNMGLYQGKLVAIDAAAMLKQIVDHTCGWPICISGELFELTSPGMLEAIKGEKRLFAWLHDHFDVEWKSSNGISKSEFYEFLCRKVTQYSGRSNYPHYPPIDGFYYHHNSLESSNGEKLEGFINFFSTGSQVDRELIKAFCMTLFWGGPAGMRPGFIITTNDHGPNQGRGYGKTTLVDAISKLADGKLAIENNESMDDFRKRMINNNKTFRLIVLDNLKSMRFSSAGLESLITSDEISAKRLYSGNGTVPNYYTVAITVNGVHLSKDMAQRCIKIELAEPQHHQNWYQELNDYISEHRWGIISDILDLLQSEGQVMDQSGTSRWATWERAVLSKVECPESVREAIKSRCQDSDDDLEAAQIFLQQLNDCALELKLSSCKGVIKISHEIMHEQLKLFLGLNIGRNAVAKRISDMGLVYLHKVKQTGRQVVWVFNPKGKSITNEMIVNATSVQKPSMDDDFEEVPEINLPVILGAEVSAAIEEISEVEGVDLAVTETENLPETEDAESDQSP
jgi:hypothetical protein